MIRIDRAGPGATPAGHEDGAESLRRAEVILTAARLFRKHGYERTTVRELARAVGLQSGSLFHHFRSKEEILVAVMNNGIQEVIDGGQQALARYDAPADRLAASSAAEVGDEPLLIARASGAG